MTPISYSEAPSLWRERLCVEWREVGGGEEGADGILGADGWSESVQGLQRPGDVEGGVVPKDAALPGWVVEVGRLVEDFGGVGEDEEAVGEAFGDPEELERI